MENYERTELVITEFDAEDIITTSDPRVNPYELPVDDGKI